MIYLIVYFIGLIVILLINNILDEFDIDLIFNDSENDLMVRSVCIIFWPMSIPLLISSFIIVGLFVLVKALIVKLIRRIINMKFTFSLKEISRSIRKSFAPKEKVVKSKKKYSRKNKSWKKEI